MAHVETAVAAHAGKRVRLSDAERRERLEDLVLRRTKLSPSEVVLLHEFFGQIIAAQHQWIWNRLRKRGLREDEIKDLVQNVYEKLYTRLLEGFPDHMTGLVRVFTEGELLNLVRDGKRAPFSVGLPSSSQQPGSVPDLVHAVDLREIARRLLVQLAPEHLAVVEKVILNGLSHDEAAEALNIPVGTVKSRLIAAKHHLRELAEVFVPLSQR